jgi:sugar phosphate permease
MAPMADQVMADFDIGAMVFGGLAAAYFYIYAGMQLPSGALADTLRPRKTITMGLLISTAGSIIMGISPSFAVLYAGRVLSSFGVSIIWLSVLKLVMVWFGQHEVATMIGFSATVATLGQVAAATLLALLIMWMGWRMSFMFIGAVSLVLAAVGGFIIRDSPTQVSLPLGARPGQQTVRRTSSANDWVSLASRFKLVLRNRYLWPPCLVALGTYGAYATVFHNWMVVYVMQSYNVARDFAANFILVAAIGFMVGSPALGFLSDRILKRRRLPAIILAGLILGCLLLLALWGGGKPPLAVLYPLCFFIGFGTGVMPLTLACVRDVVQPSIQGVGMGLVNMGAFAIAAIMQPVFGYILDLGWQGHMLGGARLYPLEAFQNALLACCALAGVGLIGALFVRETHASEIYTA